MVNFSNVDDVRESLAQLCLEPAHRIVAVDAGIERQRWRPYSVMHRATLGSFTDEGAWAHIADLLRSDVDVDYKPPTSEFDDHAYVIIDEEDGFKNIYVKIALCLKLKKVIGISFHYAEY